MVTAQAHRDADPVHVHRGRQRVRICRVPQTLAHHPPAEELSGFGVHVREVLGLCADVQEVSDGYFTASIAGALDPSGLVKGWAIERASALLSAAGARSRLLPRDAPNAAATSWIRGPAVLRAAWRAAPSPGRRSPWWTGTRRLRTRWVRPARDWIEGLDGYEAYAVTESGTYWATESFPFESCAPSLAAGQS